MLAASKIAPCLWFDSEAEQAVAFYTRIFKNSRIVTTSHYGEAGREIHRRPPGTVMAIGFELEGQSFTALNGGPLFKFNEAVSLQATYASQEEIAIRHAEAPPNAKWRPGAAASSDFV